MVPTRRDRQYADGIRTEPSHATAPGSAQTRLDGTAWAEGLSGTGKRSALRDTDNSVVNAGWGTGVGEGMGG